MAENSSTILIDVELDTSKLASEIGNATQKLEILKGAEKQLNDEFQKGKISSEDYGLAIASVRKGIEEANRSIKSKTALLQASEIAEVSSTQSLEDQRQALNTLQKAYAALSGSEKEQADAAGGLREKIDELSESVKAQEKSIGDARRNVGNYPKEITALIPGWDGVTGKMEKLNAAATVAGGVGVKGFKAMASGIGQTTKAALKFIATPVGAIIAAVVVVLKAAKAIWDKLTDAIKKNDDAGTAIARLYAVVVQPVIDAVTKVFAKLAEWIGKAAGALADFLGGSTDAGKTAEKLVVDIDNLQERERKYVVQSAKNNSDIAKLRDKAVNKEKYTADQRKKFLQDAIDLEKQNLEEDKAIKAEQLRIMEETAKREQDTSDETKDKIAQARAAMYQAEQAYFTKTKELNSQIIAFDTEQTASRKKAADEAAKIAKEQAEARKQIEQDLQDALIEQITDATQKQMEKTRVAGEREVEELKKRFEKLKKTDKEGRDKLNELIKTREIQIQQEIEDIAIRGTVERANRERSILQQEIELQLKDQVDLANERYQNAIDESERLANLKKSEREALYEDDLAFQEAFLAAQQAQADAYVNLERTKFDQAAMLRNQDYENRRAMLQQGDVELFNIEFQQAADENEALLQLNDQQKAALFESDQAYEQAVLDSERRLFGARKAYLAETKRIARENTAAISGALGTVSDLLDQFSEESKGAAIASKAIALGKIAIDTGVAIAGGVAQAQSVPFPANIAAIATTIATVLANMASAISTVKSANFATGGIVEGKYDARDSVRASLSGGEMVLNPAQQKTLFDMANMGQASGINYELLGQTMAAAVAEQPAPVMVYDEFQQFGDKVATYKEIAAI